jgi:hypothetical protein
VVDACAPTLTTPYRRRTKGTIMSSSNTEAILSAEANAQKINAAPKTTYSVIDIETPAPTQKENTMQEEKIILNRMLESMESRHDCITAERNSLSAQIFRMQQSIKEMEDRSKRLAAVSRKIEQKARGIRKTIDGVKTEQAFFSAGAAIMEEAKGIDADLTFFGLKPKAAAKPAAKKSHKKKVDLSSAKVQGVDWDDDKQEENQQK